MVMTLDLPQGVRLNPRNTFEVCEGMSIQVAIDAAAAQLPAPSATNPWTILVYPGIYDEAITCASWVNLRGVGPKGSVVIYQDDAAIIQIADNIELQNFTVRLGTPAVNFRYMIYDFGVACTARMTDLVFEITNPGAIRNSIFIFSGTGTYTIERCTHRIAGTGESYTIYNTLLPATIHLIDNDFEWTASTTACHIRTDVAGTWTGGGNRWAGICGLFEISDGTIILDNDAKVCTGANSRTGGSIFFNTEAGPTLVVAASDSLNIDAANLICDGIDDHLEIQAAIDALPATGGEVRLLDGTYNIEVSLVLDSYQTLRGCGRSTILTTTTADTDIITATGGDGSEKVGIVIADLCIDGSAGGAVNDVGIIWTYVNYSEIRNIWCQNHGEDGIDLANCEFNKIIGNTINLPNWDGIYLSPLSNYNTISGNTFLNGTIGVDLDNSHGNTISGNTFSGNDNAIYVSDSHGNAISGNTCSGSSSTSIVLAANSYNNTISANTVTENYEGIMPTNSSNNTISGNTIMGNLHHGIFLEGSSNNIISGNTCIENSQGADNTYDNIYSTGSDYNLIVNNLCRASTIGTTLTTGETAGATDIHVTTTDDFEVGMGVVIDLGGGNEEYHRISAITAGTPGIITIDAGLTNNQGAGETIDVPEARYGINIGQGTCDKNIIQGNDLYDAGKTANLNDAGTLTEVRDNRGTEIYDNKIYQKMKNTSGGALAPGDVVIFKIGVAAGNEITTTITKGDDYAYGMVAEAIEDNTVGLIQIGGKTTALKVDGTDDIAIGDFICAFTTAKIGCKAGPGDMAFAIALEAYTTDNSNGVIDALIVSTMRI